MSWMEIVIVQGFSYYITLTAVRWKIIFCT